MVLKPIYHLERSYKTLVVQKCRIIREKNIETFRKKHKITVLTKIKCKQK